jgi:hypothetical protein
MVNEGNPIIMVLKGGIFLNFFFFYVRYSTLIHLPSLRFYFVSEDAGIETRTVATTALAVRRRNHSARSHPLIMAVLQEVLYMIIAVCT